ncbi:hypothetical protein [Allosalinactinospora lopnorensis]|uniref:hypothetical protein n=1 Tax=Allosalinactinospora lopnorensis TaxID=1352348 RepID=UPI0012E14C97|nr:hypothetical protein [Allosalinactinospora lopnorensis]
MVILPPRRNARIRPYLLAAERRRRTERQARAAWIVRRRCWVTAADRLLGLLPEAVAA